jgi:hydroxymethylglutaryl-CoA reductase
MTEIVVPSSPLQGLYRLDMEARRERLLAAGVLEPKEVALLADMVAPEMNALSDQFVENALGSYPLPFGVVPDFVVDGVSRVIPMAVEETSIIAALSSAMKWVRQEGEISTEVVGRCRLGQIYFPSLQNDIADFIAVVATHKAAWLEGLNADLAKGLVKRGGGVQDLQVRPLLAAPGEMHAVVHVLIDTCDAMGANIITQVCEALKPMIEAASGEQGTMCIVSNLSDTQLTRARVVIRQVSEEQGRLLEQASRFAELDPYRAATSNKGVMNGMDAVLVATGNDWRAVEAGVHAYAAKQGQYRSITRWRWHDDGRLVGELEAPIATGCVGGITKLHPLAQLSLRLLQVSSSAELSRTVAAVGLMQNLAAIRALMGKGIVQGHMRLHIDNLLLAAGANPAEKKALKPQLEAFLQDRATITLGDVREQLQQLRAA